MEIYQIAKIPENLRKYFEPAPEIGLEETPEAYVERLVQVFRAVRRVLRDDGTLWLNLGDKYAQNPAKGVSGRGKNSEYLGGRDETKQTRANSGGLGEKNMLGMPWCVAFALQADGWTLRSDIIWHKPNAMPNSQRDRPSTNHEYVFLLTKGPRYFYDDVAIREPAVCARMRGPAIHPDTISTNGNGGLSRRPVGDDRTKRTVWTVNVASEKESHFAVFPPKLITPCILAGTSAKGCCDKCGAPQRRVVEKRRKATRPGESTKVAGGAIVHGNRDPQRHVTEMKTIGWESTCECGAAVVPCTVLDPFGGSGTTGAVAVRHNRRAILIELNEVYIEIMKRKLKKALAKRGFGL